MPSKFMRYDRDTLYLMPPSIQDWLPKDHLARFIVDVVEELDLKEFEQKYAQAGRKAYPIQIMLGLLFYGYITGIHSSRKIEKATYESVPFRFIAANLHPDHDTIASFRKTFLEELKGVFIQILLIASKMGIFEMGNVSVDGSKIKANASKHKALSWDYTNKLEKKIEEEISQLMKMAEEADAKKPEGMDIPEELTRRKERLEIIRKAKKEIESRAQKRFEEENSEYEKKMTQQKNEERKTKKKKGGKKPKPPISGPTSSDQVNLTDKESRIMPKSGGGFEQAYNAQASVNIESMMIVGNHVTQQANDKNEVAPAIKNIQKAESLVGKCDGFLADAGFFSKKNVQLCEKANMTPYIVDRRDKHNKSLMKRFEDAGEPPEDADAVESMKYRLKTKDGKELYGKRKSTVEPVFGIIKNVMKFKSFLLRGLKAVIGEWNLVAIAWNIKRMFALQV